MPDILVTITSLSTELGMDRRTLGLRLADLTPVPMAKKGKGYRLRDVLPRVATDLEAHGMLPRPENDGDLLEWRRRGERARALVLEYDLAERQGVMMDVNEVKEELDRAFAAIRAKLLAIPSKFAPLVNPGDPGKARKILDVEIRQTLEELSSAELVAEASGSPPETLARRA